MYTIILVDDERLTLDTLANYIDWEQMSCRVIATANNGRDALKKIEALQPDILITDVKCPSWTASSSANKYMLAFLAFKSFFSADTMSLNMLAPRCSMAPAAIC